MPKKQQYIAHVAVVFHVDGLMSDNIGILARVVEVQLPTIATKYQCFYNGLFMIQQIAKERHLDLERVEVLGCFKSKEEAQACCTEYLTAYKAALELHQNPKLIT